MPDPGIIFDDHRIVLAYPKVIVDNMAQIWWELVEYVWTEFGERVLVTSIYRADPKSVHSDFRGIDGVPENRKVGRGSFGVMVMEDARNYINKRWDYGKEGYQVIPDIFHNPKSGPHWHVQRRPGEETKRIL